MFLAKSRIFQNALIATIASTLLLYLCVSMILMFSLAEAFLANETALVDETVIAAETYMDHYLLVWLLLISLLQADPSCFISLKGSSCFRLMLLFLSLNRE